MALMRKFHRTTGRRRAFRKQIATSLIMHGRITTTVERAKEIRPIVERYITGQRQLIVAAFENWWDKYKVTLTEIERERDAAAVQLQLFLKGLRYV